jgi:hypothetical protein
MGWKVYFWLLTLSLAALYGFTFYSTTVPVFCYFDVPISVVGLVGLFGFAHHKRIAHAMYWRMWFFGLLLWDTLFNLVLSGWVRMEPVDMLGSIIIYGLLVPEYVALYLYGFRSKPIWQAGT